MHQGLAAPAKVRQQVARPAAPSDSAAPPAISATVPSLSSPIKASVNPLPPLGLTQPSIGPALAVSHLPVRSIPIAVLQRDPAQSAV